MQVLLVIPTIFTDPQFQSSWTTILFLCLPFSSYSLIEVTHWFHYDWNTMMPKDNISCSCPSLIFSSLEAFYLLFPLFANNMAWPILLEFHNCLTFFFFWLNTPWKWPDISLWHIVYVTKLLFYSPDSFHKLSSMFVLITLYDSSTKQTNRNIQLYMILKLGSS